MRTLSEISEELWQIWFEEQQAIARPIVEKMIREKLDLDESFEITWSSELGEKHE